MIDTIKIRKIINCVERQRLESMIEQKALTGAVIFYPNENRTISAKWKNLQLQLNESSLNITGSLTKLYHGNNVNQLRYDQLIAALRSIELLLGISLDDALITRIDVACNVALNEKVRAYMALLNLPKGFKLMLYENETKYFTKEGTTYCIYDKVKELKANMAYEKSDKNLLRVEVRFTKNIAKQLSWEDNQLRNLYDFQDYNNMVKKFWACFCKIPFSTNHFESPFDFSSGRKVIDKLILDGIEHNGGKDQFLSTIKSPGIKKDIRFRLRQMIERLPKGSVKNLELINELGVKLLSVCKAEIDLVNHYSFDAPDDNICN